MGLTTKPKDPFETLTEDAVKDMIYGAIKELIKDPKNYYKGYSDEFSNITPEGESHITAMLTKFIPLIERAESKKIVDRAKEIIYGQLRDEETAEDNDEDEQ
jgi:hypothetical protein